MGQESYLIRTGVGFDVDRSGSRDAIGFMESVADGMNTMQMKKSVEGITKRNAKLKKLNNDLEKDNKAATEKRKKDVDKSAESMQKSIQNSMGKIPPATTKGSSKAAKKARADFESEMKNMNDSYTKFAKRAEKLGMKVGKAGKRGKQDAGFGTGESSKGFMKAEAEDRQRQINLVRTMIEENEKLAKVEGLKGKRAAKDNEFLIKQEKQMIKMDKEAIGLEKKEAKTKQKNYRTYKKEAAKEHKRNKRAMHEIKERTNAYKKMGKALGSYTRGIAGGMKNAFIIGSAAAAAFAYKLQPVAQEVMKFETEFAYTICRRKFIAYCL